MLHTLLISAAHAQEAAAAGAAGMQSPLSGFIPLILIFVLFYFLLIRPQQKKFKDHQAMVSAIARGDKVITGGGIHGKVTKVEDAHLTVEIAAGVEVVVERATVSQVLTKPGAADKAQAA